MTAHPLLKAGERNRLVTIERATIARDSRNEETETWGEHKQRLAAVKPAPGTERFQSAELAASAPLHFFFLYEPDLVTVKDRIIYEGKTFTVVSIEELGFHEGFRVMGSARAE